MVTSRLDGVLGKVERHRLRERMTQTQVAASCGISQGHYSKMLAGKASVGRACERAMSEWLVRGRDPATGAFADGSAERLAASISEDVARLAEMLGKAAPAMRGR